MDKKNIYIGLFVPMFSLSENEGAPDSTSLVQPTGELAHETGKNQSSPAELFAADMIPQEPEIDESIVQQEEGEDENSHDVDSIDQDSFESPEYARGNWYKKQQVLKYAHDVYQEVRQKEASVGEFENVFIAKKNNLTQHLEEFSQSLGVAFAGFYQILFDEIERFEQTEPATGLLTSDDRIKLAQDQETKAVLVQLKKDLDDMTELYKAADQAMTVLLQQIMASHNFEQKAFENYEKIAHVLSDQVAEQLYGEIVAARENINGILGYIQGDFTRYFDELSENIIKSFSVIKQEMALLNERGINFFKPVQKKVETVSVPAAQPKGNIVFRFFSQIFQFFSFLWKWMRGFFA